MHQLDQITVGFVSEIYATRSIFNLKRTPRDAWRVGANPGASKYAGEAEIEDPKDGGWQFTVEANGRSPALALCIAALRARTPPTEETG